MNAPVDRSRWFDNNHAAAARQGALTQKYSKDGSQPSTSDPLLSVGDTFTIHGVEQRDTRKFWQKARDFILRRPPPELGLQRVLPWPSGVLSPNSRHHWRAIAKAKKEYRAACGVLALADGARLAAPVMAQAVEAGHKIRLHCDFFPPDRRRHDDSNCMHRMKAGIDGIADALGIDDRHFKTSYDLREQIGGFVRLTMTIPT